MKHKKLLLGLGIAATILVAIFLSRFVSHSKVHNSFVKNMYPGLEPVVEVDQEELTKKYANCLKLIHLGNYLCTPKVDYSSERKRMLSLERPNFIVVEQRSKKKSQKDSGICFF